MKSNNLTLPLHNHKNKKKLKEIENNYNNHNYSDRIVLRSLLSDISSIKEREREKEIETEISSITSNSDDIKLLMTIPGMPVPY